MEGEAGKGGARSGVFARARSGVFALPGGVGGAGVWKANLRSSLSRLAPRMERCAGDGLNMSGRHKENSATERNRAPESKVPLRKPCTGGARMCMRCVSWVCRRAQLTAVGRRRSGCLPKRSRPTPSPS